MIALRRLDGTEIHLNPDVILSMEMTPDTHLTLTTGNQLVVLENVEVVLERIVAFKARVLARALGRPERRRLEQAAGGRERRDARL